MSAVRKISCDNQYGLISKKFQNDLQNSRIAWELNFGTIELETKGSDYTRI